MAIKSSAPRYVFVDALRGLASLGVLLAHMVVNGMSKDTLQTLLPTWFQEFCFNGQFGVEVFFVLSGFVIALSLSQKPLSKTRALNFVLRPQIRLDPPYFVALVAFMFLQAAFGKGFPRFQNFGAESIVLAQFGRRAGNPQCGVDIVFGNPVLSRLSADSGARPRGGQTERCAFFASGGLFGVDFRLDFLFSGANQHALAALCVRAGQLVLFRGGRFELLVLARTGAALDIGKRDFGHDGERVMVVHARGELCFGLVRGHRSRNDRGAFAVCGRHARLARNCVVGPRRPVSGPRFL